MSVFKYEQDADGIVTVTMDMTGPVNAMNEEYRLAMDETLARLEAEQGLTGVVLASAKKVFFAGGDLNDLLAAKPGDEAAFMAAGERVKSGLAAAKTRGKKLGRQAGERPKSDRLASKVIALSAEGRSYRWIARDLGISKNTVTDIVKRSKLSSAPEKATTP